MSFHFQKIIFGIKNSQFTTQEFFLYRKCNNNLKRNKKI